MNVLFGACNACIVAELDGSISLGIGDKLIIIERDFLHRHVGLGTLVQAVLGTLDSMSLKMGIL